MNKLLENIKKILYKILKVLFSRIVITALIFLVQIAIMIITTYKIKEFSFYSIALTNLLGVIFTLHIISTQDNPSYKLAWIIPVLMFPIFGVLLYGIFGGNKIRRKLKKQIEVMHDETLMMLPSDKKIIEEIENEELDVATQVKYITNNSQFPVYKNTSTKYFSPGEKFFDQLILELKKAKKYIFMEYFIIAEGLMWNTILDILKEKAKAGLDVRIIYDDFGCFTTLPNKYFKELEEYGIKVIVFNKVVPVLSAVINNRDHRKITVIDGHTAFTGGINLADEYINKKIRFGHWKDSAIMVKGEAVWSFTIMFLHIWTSQKNESLIDYKKYLPKINSSFVFEDDGYVQPYGDSPYDNELVGENVYLNMINKAKKYVYIATPYLIVDNELITALTIASKSGIDVRIITPHIEDKWYVHQITRSNYLQLIECGVKIYEYLPGFIHSKVVVSDDKVATVGTINFDYRSLYLHFECGVFLYKTKSISEIKKDYLETLKHSIKIEKADAKNVRWYNRLFRAILRVFSPLM